jgi:ribosome-associated heat shock protein Hsp15
MARSAEPHARRTGATESRRLDQWLWFARFLKTRTAAARFVQDGHVRLNRKRVDDPAQGVKPGQVLTLAFPHATRVVRVLSAGFRRGPPAEARTLYEDLDEGRGDVPADVPLAPSDPSG